MQDLQELVDSKSLSFSKIKEDLILILKEESEAINYLIKHFPIEAEILVRKILNVTTGRVIFCGMGKSGLICKKLAATFSSIGTPSLSIHPSDALHGDLGMILPNDFFIAISKSGSGKELEQIIPILKSFGNFTSLICCSKGYLSKLVNLTIKLPFKKEACHLNLAPTSSSTLTLAFGDAVAVVVSKIKNFTKNDFAKFHPAGALGKKLLLKVSSLMIEQDIDLPYLNKDTKFTDLLFEISSKKLGIGIVIDDNKKVLGVLTDGDLRRACESGKDVFDKKAKDIMTLSPKKINKNILAYDALLIMEKFNITSLVVVNDNDIMEGLIHIHDILKSGIMIE